MYGDLNGALSVLLTAEADDWAVHRLLSTVDRAQDAALFDATVMQKNMVLSPQFNLDRAA